MISNEIADRIIAAAEGEKRRMDVSGHEFRESHNQPLGYHVFTVATAAAPDHSIPFAAWIERSNDRSAIRQYLLSAGVMFAR